MKKVMFSIEELSEMQSLQVKGGFSANPLTQTECVNYVKACGSGIDQIRCINDVDGCGMVVVTKYAACPG